MEGLEVAELLADRREHDRPLGDGHDGERGTAAGVAVELRQDDGVEPDSRLELLGGAHRVLADHGVDHEEDVVRTGGVADVAQLLHEVGVDGQAAGGVDDDDVVDLGLGERARRLRHRDRVTDAVAGLGREHDHAGLLAHDLELVDGVGPLQVGGHQQRRVAVVAQVEGELAGQRRLARALEAGEQDDRRPGLREGEPRGLAAEHGHELLVDDLDDLLRRVQRAGHLRRQRALLDRRGELPHHGQGDVGLEQGGADLADGGVDVRLGQPALAAQSLEGRSEPVGEGGEHGRQRNRRAGGRIT